jgi:hypothetical protein
MVVSKCPEIKLMVQNSIMGLENLYNLECIEVRSTYLHTA